MALRKMGKSGRITVTGNVLANLFGRVWTSVLQFAMTPIIIGLLGPKAYGLVGFNALLMVSFSFLNSGVSASLIREIARWKSRENPDEAQDIRDLLRSLEIPVIFIGMVLGGFIMALAPLIAGQWLKIQDIPLQEVTDSLRLIGLGVACVWPGSFYSGGFSGLQRQHDLARLTMAQVTITYGGAVLLLMFLAPRPEVFFVWQAAVSLVFSFLVRRRLLSLMPAAPRPGRFSKARLKPIWRLSAGTMVIALTSGFLTQADTMLVSRYAPLDQFAAYSLSFTLAMLVVVLVGGPLGSVMLPLFSGLQAPGDQLRLAEEYHRWTQVTVFAALPMIGPLVIFPKPLLELWLGYSSPMIPQIVSILPWIVVGTMLHIMAMPPYLLQFSAGWMRLSVIKNFVALPPFLLALVLGIPKFGMVAGAWCWVALNLGFFLMEVPLTHRRLLRSDLWAWWGRDTMFPCLVASGVFVASAFLSPESPNRWIGFIQACVTSLVTITALLAVLPYPRGMAVEALRRLKRLKAPGH